MFFLGFEPPLVTSTYDITCCLHFYITLLWKSFIINKWRQHVNFKYYTSIMLATWNTLWYFRYNSTMGYKNNMNCCIGLLSYRLQLIFYVVIFWRYWMVNNDQCFQFGYSWCVHLRTIRFSYIWTCCITNCRVCIYIYIYIYT